MSPRLVLQNDFDGNMFNTMPLHGQLAADTIYRHFGISRTEAEERYFLTTGPPFHKQLEIIFPDAKEKERELCATEYHERKISEVYDNAQPFPEVKDFLQKVHGKYPLLIATGTETPLVSSLLDRHELLPYIDAVWGCEYGSKGERIGRAKKLFRPDIVIFTGDSASDVALSRIPNVVTVGRTGDQRGMLSREKLSSGGATRVMESFEELFGIIKQYE